MKLLIDAQLPKTLADALNSIGHDAVHTSQLPKGNRTADSELLRLSLDETELFRFCAAFDYAAGLNRAPQTHSIARLTGSEQPL